MTTIGGTVYAPPTETGRLRSRVVYKLVDGDDYVDISDYVYRWVTVEDIEKPISTAKINLSPVFITDDLDDTIIDGTEIRIYVGDSVPSELWFAGIKTDLEQDGVTGVMHCVNTGIELERREVTQDFIYHKDPVYSGRLVEIAKYMIDNYTTLDSQGIEYTSTKLSDKIICDHEPIIDVLKKIKETLQWEHYVRNGVYYLHSSNYIDNSVTLTVGTDLVAFGDWSRDNSNLVNKLTVYGASESHSTQQLFSGDGTENQEFELTYPYFSNVKVEIDVAGTWTEKTGAIPGSTTGTYDYTMHPDSSQKLIRFDGTTGYNPPAAADNVRVTYTHAWQVPYTAQDDISIEKYDKYEKTMYRPDLKTKDDVVEFTKKYLTNYSSPFKIGTVVCKRSNLRVGERVTIVDSRNNVNEAFTITRMEMAWPEYLCTLDVGSQPRNLGDWRRGLNERVRRLEEENRGYASASRYEWLHKPEVTINTSISYFKLETSVKGSNFLLGSSGTDILGSSGTGTPLGDTTKTTVIEETF